MQYASPFPDSIAFCLLKMGEKPLDPLLPLELQLLTGASEKRQKQFQLGRMAAHEAIRRLNFNKDKDITSGSRGEPIWPEGLVGSIAHSGQFAVAAVGVVNQYCAIGLDIEDLSKTHNPEIINRIAKPDEIAWARSTSNIPESTLRIFSAKEAIFKALYPICQRYFGFMAVELSPTKEGFEAVLQEDLSYHLVKGLALSIKQSITENHVISSIWLSAT